MPTIEINETSLSILIDKYDLAKKAGEKTLFFSGNTLTLTYVKWLIEISKQKLSSPEK